MDKLWMQDDRTSLAYQLGVQSFLKFALENARDPRNIFCPCVKCGNLQVHPVHIIKGHLFCNGIDITYTVWKEHGEECEETSDSEVSTSLDSDSVDGDDSVEGVFHEDWDDDDELSDECREFVNFVDDANKPVYPGSSWTKLSVLVKLYNLKAKFGMSDTCFSEWLNAFGQILPEGNEIPTSVYEAKKTLAALGMDYKKFHACPNDCILYWKQYQELEICPTCSVSRWKLDKEKNVREGVPAKVMWYFPPIPRFRRMYESPTTASNLIWHANERPDDGIMRHPSDAVIWKLVNEQWPHFGLEPRNLRLALSTDGFNPYSGTTGLSRKYTCWPVMLVNYNLPPSLCMKRKYMMLTMIISGPKQPGNDIDVYLQPLVEDLKLLWNGVKDVYDSSTNSRFTLRACLMWTINDFPAYGNLSGNIVRGYNACPICLNKTSPKRLVHGQKMAYMRARRWTRRDHPYRRLRAQFDGTQELDLAPIPLSGQEVLQKIEEELLPWPFGKAKPPPPYKGEENETRPCFKKKSIFFELEYWKFLPVRHCLDVMHVEKNVCDSLLGTLLNIPGKTKDGLKARLDLKQMGIRPGLHADPHARKKNQLPLASWNLNLDEKKTVCGSLFGMKVPSDYSSNISNLVCMNDLKISGLKSHDCHVLMQQLLPVALRAVLDKPVRVAVIRLCLFFNEICSKTLEVSKLPKIQSDLVETLCMLEMYFPPSFFDIMVHLTLHLVREIELCGPVFYRWMYPFERYMKVCKSYVRNKYRAEGSIAESYIAEEAIEYLSENLQTGQTVGLPKQREKVSKRTCGAHVKSIYGPEFNWAHLHVLQNTIEFGPYWDEHMEVLKTKHPKFKNNEKWLKDKQNKDFPEWVKNRVNVQVSLQDNNISNTVRWIADGPSHEVPMFDSYMINGVQYQTKSLDDVRVTQNSGVFLLADTMQVASARDKAPVTQKMAYYGVINEIWELDYIKLRVPLFKCDWCDTARGIKVDDLGFTLVNFTRKNQSSDIFVMGHCVEQVFYVMDTVDPRWSVVLRGPNRNYDDMVNEDELGDVIGDHCPFADRMPEVPILDDDTGMGYLRVDDEGIIIVDV